MVLHRDSFCSDTGFRMIKLSYFVSWHLIDSKHISTLSPTPPPCTPPISHCIKNCITYYNKASPSCSRGETDGKKICTYMHVIWVMSMIHRGWGEVDHPHGCLVVVLINLKLKKKFWFGDLKVWRKKCESVRADEWLGSKYLGRRRFVFLFHDI